LVVVSSKEERKEKVWRHFCECLSEAVAHLPSAVSLLLLEALFMQISGVSLTLTYPFRLSLLRVLLGVTATAIKFLLSKHTEGGDTAPLSQASMFIYSSHGLWAFPTLLWSFPPTTAFTSFPAAGWACAAAPAFSNWLVRDFLSPLFSALGALPSLLCVSSVFAYYSVFFFPGWGSVWHLVAAQEPSWFLCLM
jgi:hypothetical protein